TCNLLFVIKVQKLFDMTKPRLVKVRALFYVFQYITKQRGCANFDTAPLLISLPFDFVFSKGIFTSPQLRGRHTTIVGRLHHNCGEGAP
ncbi:MAG: hypothetical protein MSH66_00695, partial [Bacteroidales bacterium]|nr:hypothetical protein [Bacteroidales bacterium]